MSPDPDCPGPGRCHGCMAWCRYCDVVSYDCDDPLCQSHARPEDVRASLSQLEADMSKCARRFHMASSVMWDDQTAVREANSQAWEFRSLEREHQSLQHELDCLLEAFSRGHKMVPRPSPPAVPDPSQLALPF